jgi:hypothetical protein
MPIPSLMIIFCQRSGRDMRSEIRAERRAECKPKPAEEVYFANCPSSMVSTSAQDEISFLI